jgi:hypothetical protein
MSRAAGPRWRDFSAATTPASLTRDEAFTASRDLHVGPSSGEAASTPGSRATRPVCSRGRLPQATRAARV